MTRIQTLTFQDVVARLQTTRHEHHQHYLAMYSSWYGGIIADPALMLTPVDDHMVHRGDGIFEAFRCIGGSLYLLAEHLDRLERSAELIHLAWPVDREEMERIIIETVRAGGSRDCLVRLFISRGPGDFSPQPYAAIQSQLYIVITDLEPCDPRKQKLGCSMRTSAIPVKSTFFANVKSCNYLPNALMKKEAADCGVDYTLGLDEKGRIAEGGTENFGLITPEGEFLVPGFERILKGTTLVRAMELARGHPGASGLSRVEEVDLWPEDLHRAAEVLVFGTTQDVLPIVEFDGRPVGTGRPGPFAVKLREMLVQDQASGNGVLTPVF